MAGCWCEAGAVGRLEYVSAYELSQVGEFDGIQVCQHRCCGSLPVRAMHTAIVGFSSGVMISHRRVSGNIMFTTTCFYSIFSGYVLRQTGHEFVGKMRRYLVSSNSSSTTMHRWLGTSACMQSLLACTFVTKYF